MRSPIQYVTLRFRYECGAASLRYRYRNCAKITVLMSEPRAILALGSDIRTVILAQFLYLNRIPIRYYMVFASAQKLSDIV